MVNNKAANPGVDALSGFEFQRNCALYLLLDDYDSFKDENFFLCIEHHDDFLFCYRTECLSEIKKVRAYQAKKLSGKIWSIDTRFSEIISKMLEVGNNLRNDSILKSANYSHRLTFISNTESELKFKPKKSEKESGKKEVTIRVNEQNCICDYNSLPADVKNRLDEKISEHCKNNNTSKFSSELDFLNLQWIDFPRTAKKQKEHLIGLLKKNFPHVVDPIAAIDLILSLFRDVETVYNQKQIVSLLDTSKRVEGEIIQKAIDIIETEQKTFDFWRNHSTELAKTFKIPIRIQNQHETYIKNSFEMLKDFSNLECQLIREFVGKNDYSMEHVDYQDMFKAYLTNIKEHIDVKSNDIDLFFACLCSYVEFHG